MMLCSAKFRCHLLCTQLNGRHCWSQHLYCGKLGLMRPGSLGGTTLVLVQLQYNIGASSSSNSQGLIIMGISLFSLSNNMWCMQPRDTRTHIQKAEIGYKWKFNFSSCTIAILSYVPLRLGMICRDAARVVVCQGQASMEDTTLPQMRSL